MACLASVAGAAHAQAQTAEAPATAASAPQPLPTVTVTGNTKPSAYNQASRISNAGGLPVEIEKQPRSITVLSNDLLEDTAQGQPLGVLYRNVPSLSQGANGEFGNFVTIRGFDATTLFDGQYASPSRSTAMFDSIEIVKGTNGLLVGGGSPGGAINYVLKRPQPVEKIDYDLSAGYQGKASNTQLYGRLDATGPLTDDLSYRLVLDATHENQFYRPSDADKSSMLYGALQWKLTGRDRFSLFAWYEDRRFASASLAGVPASGRITPNADGLVPAFDQVYADPRQRWGGQDIYGKAEWVHDFGNDWDITTSYLYQHHDEFRDISYILGMPTPSTVTVGVSRYNKDYNGVDSNLLSRVTGKFNVAGMPNLLSFGGQYRLSSYRYPGALGGTTVVDLVDPDLDFPETLYVPGGDGFRGSLAQSTAFAQDQLSVTNKLDLTAGVRYDRVAQSAAPEFTTAPTDTQTAAQSKLTWNLGAVYEIARGLNVYGGMATGFEPMDAGNNDASGALFKPQETTQYELGAKVRVAEDALATFSVFQITRKNVLTPSPTDPLANVQTGEVRSRGFEAELAGKITSAWTAFAGYTYLDPKITSDTANQGKQFANVPKQAGRLFSTYRIGSGALQGFGFGGGVTARSDRWVDSANTLRLPGYALIDAMAWYELTAKSRLQLNASNLLDKAFYANGRNANRIYQGVPRTVLLTYKGTF